MKERDYILQCLDGETIEFPDLRELLPLRSSTTSHHASLGKELDRYIDSMFPDQPRLTTAVKMIDLQSLCLLWWPKASWQELSTATKLTMWMLVLDDSFDNRNLDKEVVRHDISMMEILVRETLGLSEIKSCHSIRNTMHRAFVEPGQILRDSYTHDQLLRLFGEVQAVLNSLQMENSISMGDELPSYDEYWKYRTGTNLMGAACALTEYVYCTRVNNEVMDHNSMKDLWHWTNMVVALTNDILSFPKEAAQGKIDSLIPILFRSMDFNLQNAIDTAVLQLQQAIGKFSQTRNLVHELFPDNNEASIVADACYDYCAGFMHWSFTTPRYGVLSKSVQQAGRISQVLHVTSLVSN